MKIKARLKVEITGHIFIFRLKLYQLLLKDKQ